MSGLNPDFLDRFDRMERRLAALERRPSAYMETVIVGGTFDVVTEIPPFFTPFGGGIVAVYGRTISGEADIEVRRNGVNVFGVGTPMIIAAPDTTEIIEVDPPVYVTEGDVVQVVVTNDDGLASGLSVGVIIHP